MLLHSVAQPDADAAEAPVDANSKVKVLEYQIVSAPSASNVESTCKMLIGKGWRPQGGVSVGASATGVGRPSGARMQTVFCQAMVR